MITNFFVMPGGDLIVPRGLRQYIIDECTEMGEEILINDKRKLFDFIHLDSSLIKYRSYQSDAVNELIGKSPEGILVSPAGSGKTIMGLSLIPVLGQPTLWLTHTGPLMTQAVERAKAFLPDIGKIGKIGASKWELGDVLTIATIQTLSRNIDKLIKMRDKFGLVIQDECHHVAAKTFTDVICHTNPYYLYGLTATPYRGDKLEALMYQAIGSSKTIVPLEKVKAEGGVIMPIVLYREIRSKYHDGNDIQLILKEFIVDNDRRNSIIVSDVIREAKEGHFCIVLSDRREHCEELYSRISTGWEKTGIATGKYSKKYVNQQVDAYNDNRITVLVATSSLLGEGFDVPFLDRAFITMPFRSMSKAEQLIGRIQRSFDGKNDAVLYDYVDINIGVLKNQFFGRTKGSRSQTYSRLGVKIFKLE